MNTVITIGRQFGSAGREIGEQVAKEFGIKYYDKELLSRAESHVVRSSSVSTLVRRKYTPCPDSMAERSLSFQSTRSISFGFSSFLM